MGLDMVGRMWPPSANLEGLVGRGEVGLGVASAITRGGQLGSHFLAASRSRKAFSAVLIPRPSGASYHPDGVLRG